MRGCWGTMDSANQQQPGWAKVGGGREELFCFFPRPGSGGGREGGEDRDAGQQARCSNAQSGSDVLFQQTPCLEPRMKVPNGAPLPRNPPLSLITEPCLCQAITSPPLSPTGKPMKNVLVVALLVIFQVRFPARGSSLSPLLHIPSPARTSGPLEGKEWPRHSPPVIY